jgi:hypothetical protein
MSNRISELKKEMETKLAELRLKRKNIIARFKKKLEEAKIEQIKNSILNK